jgi:hypothetical protein
LEELVEAEKALDIESLMKNALDNIEVITVTVGDDN